MKKIRILLVDDHVIFREGLHLLLSQESTLEVVGEAGDSTEALRLATALSPDLIVMDIGMPGRNGVETTRDILKKSPHIRFIGLSVYSDRRFVLGMLGAGATGYLLKNCAGEELVLAIQQVLAGQIYVSRHISGIVVGEYIRQSRGEEASSRLALTVREREVVRLLALGQHNKQIAVALNISARTVESHRQHAMEKLGFHSVADLTRFAIREGLVSPED